MKKKITHYFLYVLALTALYIQPIAAQQLELFSSSASLGDGPNSTGPVTATLRSNIGTSTTNTTYTPATTVSISFSNQQYTSSTYPGLTTGARAKSNDVTTLNPYAIFMPLSTIGSPIDAYFSSAPTTNSGNIVTTDNYGFMLLTDAYYQLGNSLTARNYYGDITFTFNRPVINPVLHLSGIGGVYANSVNSQVQGFYTEFELSTANVTAGYTLTRLSGSTHFALDGTNTKIINTNTDNYTYATQANYTNAAVGGSAGSVRVNSNGAGITSATFRVYLRGSGGSRADALWGNPASTIGRPGDGAIVSVSLAQNNLSGNIYNDNDAVTDGTVDGNLVNGTAVLQSNSISVPLYANLVQGGVVIGSTSVNSSGAYSFTALAAGVYDVIISTSATSTTPILPIGWFSTGEWNGTSIPNHDGTANGSVSIAIGGSDITNVNFGINQPPTAGGGSNVAANPEGTIQVTVPANTFTNLSNSSDLASGVVTGISLTSFPANVTSLFVNGTQYFANNPAHVAALTALVIPANNIGAPTVTITADPAFNTTGSIVFNFVAVDNAGLRSTVAGTATLVFSSVVPVEWLYFNAAKQNNQVLLTWATATEQNSKGFEVQRSHDGYNWRTIGFTATKAIAGNSNQQLTYTFIDKQPLPDKNIYRLKQLDFDENYAYSHVETTFLNQLAQIQVYPNPGNYRVTVKGLQGSENIKLTNILGQQVYTVKVVSHTTTIDIQLLPAGIYFIVVIDNTGKIIYNEKLSKK